MGPKKAEAPIDPPIELSNLSDDELQKLDARISAVRKNRLEMRKAAAKEANEAWLQKFSKILEMSVIDILAPEHLKGCSDKHPARGLADVEDSVYHEKVCARCVLIGLHSGNTYSPSDQAVKMEIEFKNVRLEEML